MAKKRKTARVKRMLPASRTPDKTAPVGVGRTYKDSLFRFIFRDKGNLLQLYNALNGSEYQDENLLEITTIENVIYLGYKNDVSFLLDSVLSLVEQQSSWNPNMPLRGVWYFARLYREYVDSRGLDYLGTKLLELPFPQYIVFYNGTSKRPEREILSLTEAFRIPTYLTGDLKIPALECRALVLNINYGKNRKLLEKCRPLLEYSRFIFYIRENLDKGMSVNTAVDLAVDRCLAEEILTEILQKHRKEVTGMFLEEFDKEKHERWIRKEGYEDGANSKLKSQIKKKLARGKTVEEIADDLEESVDVIERMLAEINAEEKDLENEEYN